MPDKKLVFTEITVFPFPLNVSINFLLLLLEIPRKFIFCESYWSYAEKYLEKTLQAFPFPNEKRKQ